MTTIRLRARLRDLSAGRRTTHDGNARSALPDAFSAVRWTSRLKHGGSSCAPTRAINVLDQSAALQGLAAYHQLVVLQH